MQQVAALESVRCTVSRAGVLLPGQRRAGFFPREQLPRHGRCHTALRCLGLSSRSSDRSTYWARGGPRRPLVHSTIRNTAPRTSHCVAQTLPIARYSSDCSPCESPDGQHSEQPIDPQPPRVHVSSRTRLAHCNGASLADREADAMALECVTSRQAQSALRVRSCRSLLCRRLVRSLLRDERASSSTMLRMGLESPALAARPHRRMGC